MGKDINKTNKELIEFWDSAIALSEENKKELEQYKDEDYRSLAPSEKLCDAVVSLKDCNHILDYGCGNGWASIIAIKSGAKKVTAVDVIQGGIDSAKFYAELLGIDSGLVINLISPNWIKETKDTFDGFICSNVLDVLPLETTKEIIENASRILVSGAKVIIGLNFYLSKEVVSARNMNLEEGKYLFMNGVLRLTNLSDDEWKELFEPYFVIEKFEYFAWPGEAKETRRLFYLRKK